MELEEWVRKHIPTAEPRRPEWIQEMYDDARAGMVSAHDVRLALEILPHWTMTNAGFAESGISRSAALAAVRKLETKDGV